MSEENEVERLYMAEWSEDAGFGAMDYFVYAQDFDAQRLRADTAEAELSEMTDNFNIVVRQKIELAKQNGEFSKLMQEFCRRVEAGEVRSKTTYEKFKAALSTASPATINQQGAYRAYEACLDATAALNKSP